jgi:predicted O-linked N-acetylglucosamine transferase (SPINDLY family)
LKDLKQLDAAMASYDRAIAIKPDYAEAYSNRGNALLQLKQLEAAVTSFERAIAIKPDSEFIYGKLLHTQMHLCTWGNHEASLSNLKRQIEHGNKVSMPFPVLACIDDPNLHKLAAEIWTRTKCPPGHALGAIKPAGKKNKVRIRIGYYSADFRNHPVTHLMAGIFELHDKSRYELVAFSFGPNGNDEMRQRVSTAFDQFIDVQNMSDRDAAALSREMEIDIAIDLSGFTQNSRTGIFAERCAPIQVNYLGYPGTMGAPYVDYIIADRQVIPEENQMFYSEKIAYLPDSYLPTSHQIDDSRWQDANNLYTRARFGLPDSGFVFCCFNNNYKITPTTFDGWMTLLERVEGSVLWLFEDNPTAAGNLRQAAGKRGVDKNRLIFAKRVPLLSEHFARYRFADLFLDTLPYNAHTTASDALWAGLPVLTCMGQSFASRVAGSLLQAIGLPELITHTQEEYEKCAIELATNPDKLAAIKQKLEANRLTKPLFDSKSFTRHLEAIYTAMHERYHTGLPPDHLKLVVEAQPG